MGCNNVEVDTIKKHIQEYYTRLFHNEYRCSAPIKQGQELARALAYPLAALDFIPDDQWAAFAPCGNPLPYLTPAAGDRVLNLGCGAAVDSFALAASHGNTLEIVNLDVVFGIVQQGAYRQTGDRFQALHWICADGETLPFAAGCFAWVMMNGVLNLFPDKAPLLAEINRVLKPSGTLVGADLCCTASLPDYFAQEKDAWAWCMSGAATTAALRSLFHAAGFQEIKSTPQDEDELFQRIIFVCRKVSVPQS